MRNFRSSAPFRAFVVAAALAVAAIVVSGAAGKPGDGDRQKLDKIQHIVVIYEENHSFDNLYGGWEGVNGRSNADRGAHDPDRPGRCAVHLPAPERRQPDVAAAARRLHRHDDGDDVHEPLHERAVLDRGYIPTDATTCPPARASFAPNGLLHGTGNLPGGCTRDIVHRFYQEQYQLNNGTQNRYTTGSDAVGLTHGLLRHDSAADLPVPAQQGPPALRDRRQLLPGGVRRLVPQPPVADRCGDADAGRAARATQHSILDSNGMPNNYPLYHADAAGDDPAGTRLHRSCGARSTRTGLACGDYAVNTIQPPYQPFKGDARQAAAADRADDRRRAERRGRQLGVVRGRLVERGRRHHGAGLDERAVPGVCGDPNSIPNPAWPYCPNKVFQYHHQPFNYYAAYAPGTTARTRHICATRSSSSSSSARSDKACKLKSVSFVKPIGAGERAPRLRERAAAAATTSSTC